MLPPLGGVFPARETFALRTLEPGPDHPPVEPVQVQEAQELLSAAYATDAHFCAYYPSTMDPFPRCAKELLPLIREAGADLLCGWWVGEVDNQNHLPHADPDAAKAQLNHLFSTLTPRPHVAYTTRGGFRFLWALYTPIPVDESEQRRATFLRATLPGADLNTADWSRLWRVPNATRDGQHQHIQPWFSFLSDYARPPVTPANYPPHKPVTPPKKAGIQTNSPQPTLEECSDLLEALYAPQNQRLEAELRRRSNGRHPLHPVAWQNQPIAPPNGPGRRSSIHSLAGQAASMWAPLQPQVTPQLVYALLHIAAYQLEPDTDPKGPQDWPSELWAALTKYWATEPVPTSASSASSASIPSLTDTILGRQSNLLSQMVRGVRQWGMPDFPVDFDAQSLYVQRHMLLVPKGGKPEVYLLRPDGYYDPRPLAPGSLIPRIRQLGLTEIIPITTAEGKPVPYDHLLRFYATPFGRKRMQVGIIGPHGQPGGTLSQEPHEDEPTFHVSLFSRRTDLEPHFDPDVDEWLKAFAGPRYAQLQAWIAYALAPEEGPICALAASGAPGAGKQMLVRGITECMTPEGLYADGQAFGKYNAQLMETPFLVIDEGLPAGIPAEDRANRFRSMVDGSTQTVEAKYENRFQIDVPVRIIFTSNNTSFVDALAGKRELTDDDAEAIAVRTLLITVPREAAEHLRARGGIAYTKGWVAGSGKATPSHRRVAGHFLYLHARRYELAPPGSRFLVEGEQTDQQVLRQLQSRTDVAEQVLEALLQLVEKHPSRPQLPGVICRAAETASPKGGPPGRAGFFVSTQAVLEELRRQAQRTPGMKLPSQKTVTATVRRWSLRMSCLIRSKDTTRYCDLDLHALLREALEAGRPADVLASLIEGTYQEKPLPEPKALLTKATAADNVH